MTFWSLSGLRTLLDTETDSGSPNSEEMVSQLRENIEALFMLLLSTGVSGTATSDPSNDSNGYFYDTAAGFSDDEHNARTLLITSGNAKGNMYTIDNVTTASDRLECTGDNLYSDGVRSGDAYLILYDLKVNADGHDHDGVNSSNVILANTSVANTKLKMGATNTTAALASATRAHLSLQDWCFFPNFTNISVQSGGDYFYPIGHNKTYSAVYTARFSTYNNDLTTRNYQIFYRYLTASDEPWIFTVTDKNTGDVIGAMISDDPPNAYWGLDAEPANFEWPIMHDDWDPGVNVEHQTAWKVEFDLKEDILKKAVKDKKPTTEILTNDWEYDKKKKIWKSKKLLEV